MAGGFKYKPEGVEAIAAEFRSIRNELAAVRRALTGLGLQIDADGNLIVNQNTIESANFDGNVAAGTAGTQGWGLGSAAGNAVFNNITLRGGIIGNAALTNPIQAATAHATVQTFAWNTTMTVRASATVTVPAGFTQALVYATSTVSGVNSTTSPDEIYAGITVGGVSVGVATGSTAMSTVSYTALASSIAAQATLLTGLSGSFTVQSKGRTDFSTWASNASNVSNIDALVLFLR